MIPVPSGVRVWLAVGRTEMRKGMNGLALQVQQALGRDPHAGDLYVFRGVRGNLIKILWHDGIGMSLYAKRLEHGRFLWPRQPTARWQSRRRSWLTCSMVSIGAIRGTRGDRRPPAELRQVDSAAWRGGTLPPGFDSIGGVRSPAPLPNDLAEAHALILQQRQELAAAEARASGAAASSWRC